MKKTRFYLMLLLVFGFLLVEAQETTVSGVVTDWADNTTLPSVNVLIKGTSVGTVTDLDGKFKLTVPDKNATLIFSYIGYETQEVALNGQASLNVTMKLDIAGLEEVVVVGYGTMRKGEITSSVATVKQEDFRQGSTQDIGQLIQGKVAGLNVISQSGDPTANTQIMLRGTNTLNGTSTGPLVIIDGVPGDFNAVATEDIESIDVLKDGSAAAIYGTKGANGVIFITTKRASGSNTNKVSYSGYLTTSAMAKETEVLTADEWRSHMNDDNLFGNNAVDIGSSTDWTEEIMQTPFSQVHNISFNGGSEQTNYIFNANYKDLEGIFLKSDNKVANVRVDINHNMFDNKLKFNLGAYSRWNDYTTTGDGYSFNTYAYRQAKIYNPTAPVKNEDGSWYEQPGAFNYDNPVARIEESDGKNSSQWNRAMGTIIFEPIEGLHFKALGSYSRFNETRGYYETKDHISTVRSGLNGYASNGSTQSTDRLLELTADYANTIGLNRFTLLGGYSYEDNDRYIFWQRNVDFPTDQFGYYNIGLGNGLAEAHTTTAMNSERYLTNLIAFFGRATYSYDDKYLFTGSLRYEAASQLYGTENPWGLFPAASLGWRLSKESFLENVSFIDDLKLRVGYGVTGAQPSGLFQGLSTLSYSGSFYSNGEWKQTLTPARNQNPYLRWEERYETNFGLDYTFFEQRVFGNIDYYIRKVDGLLFHYSVPVPPNAMPTTLANVGVMKNKGLEFLINVVPVKTSDFEWTTGFNFSTNTNVLESLSNELYENTTGYINDGGTGEPIQTYTHRVEVGGPVGNFYGFKVVDITEAGKWIYEDQAGNHVYYTNGGYYYEDADGNLVESDFNKSDEDKKVLGNGIPKFNMGWNNTVRYKNIDLTIGMRGAFGFEILNFERMYLENPTIYSYNRLNTAFDKVYDKAELTENLEYNSYYIEKGDYWKIDEITIGYNFKTSKLKWLSSARVYASTRNTFTITGYKGIDPEVQIDGLEPGNDYRDKYPTTRNFTLGLNVNF